MLDSNHSAAGHAKVQSNTGRKSSFSPDRYRSPYPAPSGLFMLSLIPQALPMAVSCRPAGAAECAY